MVVAEPAQGPAAFARSRVRFETVVGWLQREEAAGLSHAELEDRLQQQGRELLRQLLQDHLDLRATREERTEVHDAGGVPRGAVERDHTRGLATVFGEVEVTRMAYRRRGESNLHPADAVLNLPREHHSHGLRHLAAVESSRGSFEQATEAICRATGQQVGKRQVEELARRGAADFEEFYAEHRPPPAEDPGDIVVVSVDGKGIVMRPEALRPHTARAAERSSTKLATRLSKGEKRNRKRMAEVGVVYDASPAPRTPSDVMAATEEQGAEAAPGPVARNKWVTASVVEDAAAVVGKVFDEAERRDPDHRRTWVALVDGNNHQIDRIRKEARARQVAVSIVIDFIHVLEYLWKAACASSLRGMPPRRPGCTARPWPCSGEEPAPWPRPSDARRPVCGWRAPPGRGPTTAPTTSFASAASSTTPPPSPTGGPSPPG